MPSLCQPRAPRKGTPRRQGGRVRSQSSRGSGSSHPVAESWRQPLLSCTSCLAGHILPTQGCHGPCSPGEHGAWVLPWSSRVVGQPACSTVCGVVLPGALPQRRAGLSLGECLALWDVAAGQRVRLRPRCGGLAAPEPCFCGMGLLLSAGQPRADNELGLWPVRGWSPAGVVRSDGCFSSP